MIYEFDEYRPYLYQRLGSKGTRTGLRKRLAEHLKVHTTFVSQVMLGKAELSLEQAEGCNSYFSHNEDEAEYFLLLVLNERAGTQSLKRRFKEKIQKMQEDNLNISERIQPEAEISSEDKAKFYSSYLFSAIHVLVSIPRFQTIDGLAMALNLPESTIVDKVNFLKQLGVIVQEKGRLSHGPNHIHLGKESSLITQHHNNWRLQAMRSLESQRADDLHYSAAISISERDAMRVKDSILRNFEENVKVISQSPEEMAYGYTFDFFSIVRDGV